MPGLVSEMEKWGGESGLSVVRPIHGLGHKEGDHYAGDEHEESGQHQLDPQGQGLEKCNDGGTQARSGTAKAAHLVRADP